jgi:penicillin amidase
VALGRNAAIGFGGTNLHAASSDFVDVSGETGFSVRTLEIKVRGGRTVIRTIRESSYGPVISDAPLLKAEGACFALRWAGHEATREFDAMLGFNRAKNWDEFREAANGFGVPGQNFVYADCNGHVGKLIAAWLPRRKQKPTATLLTPPEKLEDWNTPAVSRDLPQVYDPANGIIASANDEPPDAGFPVGFFYSTRDRAWRIAEVLERAEPASVETMQRLQRDVSSEPALALRDLVLELYDRNSYERELSRYNRPVVVALRMWDGSYDVDSSGALALELVKSLLMAGLHSATERAAYGSVWHARELLHRSLASGQKDRTSRIVAKCIEHAVPPFRKYAVWGNIHRMRLRHPLGMLPVAGRRFQFDEWGSGGNGDTVMKTGAGSGMGPHGISYGSIARHISDLSHPDRNWFCLLGGQDGWIGSDTALDQVPWWRSGRYVRLPMTGEAIARDFPHITVVKPR